MGVTINFQEAKARYLQFKNRLRVVLNGEISENQSAIKSQYKCAVGQWIYTESLAKSHHIKEVIEMEKVHADIHVSANKFLIHAVSGDGLCDMVLLYACYGNN